MAYENEYPAILEICAKLADILCIDKHNIKPLRYDEIWFEKYNIKDYEWVKGCPDFCVKVEANYNKYFYSEIKLKCVEFKKTETGGITRNGSRITNYGCTSYYLDIDPVYTNMNLFCKATGLSTSNFWISFVKEDLSEIRLITLKEINNIVVNGWNGKYLCIFGEGYGRNTYLIPKNATTDILHLTLEIFLQTTTDNMLAPYFLSWEEITGNDSLRLIDFLKQNYNIDWLKEAKINNIDNNKTIMITAGKSFISLSLNNEKTEVDLKFDNGKTDKFIVQNENGKLYLTNLKPFNNI